MTTWLFTCTCKQFEHSKVSICKNCNKCIGTKGTLTQYLFKENRCFCKEPTIENRISKESLRITLHDTDEEPEESVVIGHSLLKKLPQRYELISELGFGAFGKVSLCFDRKLKKQVAIKTLMFESSEVYIDFNREAKATAVLDHQNIVKIFDFGVAGNTPYMVLEYVKGITLDKYVQRNGPLQFDVAIPIFQKICSALAYAHFNGIFHRDLKPSNIILTYNDNEDNNITDVKLIDFGLASFTKGHISDSVSSKTNQLVGTPCYMAPELIDGAQYDAKSEIYSYGCSMYEILQGRPPFGGESILSILDKHVNEQPELLSANLIIPEALAELVDDCLSKNPDKRPNCFSSLKEKLSEIDFDEIETNENEKDSNTKTDQSSTPSLFECNKGRVFAGLLVGVIAVVFKAKVFSLFINEDLNSRTVNFKSKRVSTTTVTRITGKNMPAQISEFLVSDLGVIAVAPMGTILWRTQDDANVAYLIDHKNKVFLRVPKWKVHKFIPPQFMDIRNLNIKKHGTERFLGVNCNIYKCFNKNNKIEAVFWTSKELDIPSFANRLWCRVYAIPEEYGTPLKVKRSQKLLQPINTGNRNTNLVLASSKNDWILQSLDRIEYLKLDTSMFKLPKNYKEAKSIFEYWMPLPTDF